MSIDNSSHINENDRTILEVPEFYCLDLETLVEGISNQDLETEV